jgi:hypothetical protein
MIRILLTVFLGITILYYAFVVPRSSTSSTTYPVENTDDTLFQESSESESWSNVGDTSLFRDSMKGIVQTENMNNMSIYPAQGELQTDDVKSDGIGMNNDEDDMRNEDDDNDVPDRTSLKGKKGKKEMKRFFSRSKKGGKKGSHSLKGKKNDHNGKKGKKRDKVPEGKKESKSFKGKRR